MALVASLAVSLASALWPGLAAAHAPDVADAADATARGMPWWLIAAMGSSVALYALGWRQLRLRSRQAQRPWRRRGLAFVAGSLALAVALAPPLDPLGSQLFCAHMLQHELLMVVAAPLLVAGHPLGVWAWALAPGARRTVGAWLHAAAWRQAWRVLCRPGVAWALHAVALWAWHVPAAFDAALRDEGWHTLQHSGFLASALLYWWTVLSAGTRASQGVAIASLFATMMHSAALGALLVFSSAPWYLAYGDSAARFGLAPLEDQQLGGLLMWLPAGLVYVAAGLALTLRWTGLDGAPAGRPAQPPQPPQPEQAAQAAQAAARRPAGWRS